MSTAANYIGVHIYERSVTVRKHAGGEPYPSILWHKAFCRGMGRNSHGNVVSVRDMNEAEKRQIIDEATAFAEAAAKTTGLPVIITETELE